MTFFSQIHPYRPPSLWNNFSIFLVKKFVDHFPKIFTYVVIFTPKNEGIWEFSPKMTYFDEIDPINDYFDQIYVHKPDWNNFFVKQFLSTFPKF